MTARYAAYTVAVRSAMPMKVNSRSGSSTVASQLAKYAVRAVVIAANAVRPSSAYSSVRAGTPVTAGSSPAMRR